MTTVGFKINRIFIDIHFKGQISLTHACKEMSTVASKNEMDHVDAEDFTPIRRKKRSKKNATI